MTFLTRLLLLAAAAAAIVWLLAVWAPAAASSGEPGDDGTSPVTTTNVVPLPTVLAPAKYAGHDAEFWHTAYLQQLRRTRSLHRTLLHTPTVAEALNLACVVYGNCATLWRRAQCESKLRALAANSSSSARGLLQFLTTGRVRRYGDHAIVNGGTWATTPFWRFDVYSPYANALAAGWMITNGRGGEWSCR